MKNAANDKTKPRNILVAIYRMDHIGGSELYTYDLLNELRKMDQVQVEFFAVREGMLTEKVNKVLEIPLMSREKYDLILAAQNMTVDALRGKGPIIQICHGAMVTPELPSLYADYHVAVTQEISDSLSRKGFDNSIVLNGIDIHQKRPIKPVHNKLQTVLSLCQSEEANSLIAEACNEMGLEFIYFNKFKNPTFNIENEINEVDLVIGIGRSIFDGMACGRPCIVFDHRDYNGNKADGYLHPDLFDQFILTNCSGRFRNLPLNKEGLMAELAKYDPGDGEKLRNIVVQKLNMQLTAKQLLEAANRINRETATKKRIRLFRRGISENSLKFKQGFSKLRQDFKTLRRSIRRKIRNLF